MPGGKLEPVPGQRRPRYGTEFTPGRLQWWSLGLADLQLGRWRPAAVGAELGERGRWPHSTQCHRLISSECGGNRAIRYETVVGALPRLYGN